MLRSRLFHMCQCVSMRPGSTIMPAALIVAAPATFSFWPTAAITPSLTCTSPALMSPVPASIVMTYALLMTTLVRAGRRIAGAASARTIEHFNAAKTAPPCRRPRRLNCKLRSIIEGLQLPAAKGRFSHGCADSGAHRIVRPHLLQAAKLTCGVGDAHLLSPRSVVPLAAIDYFAARAAAQFRLVQSPTTLHHRDHAVLEAASPRPPFTGDGPCVSPDRGACGSGRLRAQQSRARARRRERRAPSLHRRGKQAKLSVR